MLSWIDLTFTDQPSFIVDSGIHPTLHENFHDLNKIEYPPPYDRLVWDFKRADVNDITTATNQVDWKFIIPYKNVHQKVNIFKKTIINIFSNFNRNKLVTFDDKDPPWMTEKLKVKLRWKQSL